MSKSAKDIARRLAELRKLTLEQLVKAKADEKRLLELFTIEAACKKEREEIEEKYGGSSISRSSVDALTPFVRYVTTRAIASAELLGREALADESADVTNETSINALNQDLLT